MKKSDCFFPSCKKTGGKALLLLLMMWVLPGIASVVAQEKIDINIKNGALTDVFKAVQNQTEYRFMYSTEDVKSYQGITMEMKGASLKDVMGTALAKTDLEWHIENQIVFIKKKADKAESVKQIRITGRVTDVNNNPIPGVTVLLEGTSMGAATDANGEYVLTLPEQKSIVLIYSFVGMVSERVVYSGQTKINVILKEDVKTMEEVVVTGYQTMRKSDVVGSMTTVKASDVMMPAYSSIDQMLQGRVAGMMVMNTSSRVGTSPKIRIRGTSTILGNQDPLWVVDGVIQPDPLQLDQNDIMVDDLKNILGNQISWLNPADIETITVLKDASATAIYGSKAANGVIVITTKRGQVDRMTVNYNGTFSFRARPSYGMFNLMNSQERIQFSREAYKAGAIYSSTPLASMNTYEGVMRMYYEKQITKDEAELAIQRLEKTNTDWFKLLTRNSFSQNHNLSMSGGSQKMTYSVSLGFSDQAGVELNNDAKNLSGRLNIGVQLHPKVHADVSLVGTIDKTWGYAAGVDPMTYAKETSRSMLAYDEKGDYYFQERMSSYSLNNTGMILGYNILNEMDHSYSKNKSSRLNATLNLSWEIIPGLKYEFVGGVNNNERLSESYAGEQTYYVANKYRGYDYGTEEYGSTAYKAAMLPFGGELYNGSSDVLAWNIQNKVSFQRVFKEDHRINVLVGTEVSSTATKDRSQTIFGYVAERGEQVVQPTPIKDIVPTGNQGIEPWGILSKLYSGEGWTRTTMTSNQFSVFATLAYSYKDRYVLNASVRNDASNRFGQDQNKRFDPTYSFGLSWNIAREPWAEFMSDILNQFTLRASYGIQGNTVASISPELILTMGSVKPYYGEYMAKISRLPNPHLSWERTKTWNFGLDVQLLQWITMNLEYYTKRSNNIINQPIALEFGREGMEVNGGRIINSGVEYSLNITPIRTKDWAWTIGLNSSKNWNEAKSEASSNVSIRNYLEGANDRVLKKGYAVSSFWSFAYRELNPENGQPEFNLIYERDAAGNVIVNEETGKPILRDVNDLTEVLVYSGKTEPDFTGGLVTRLRWKGLTLGANFSLLLGAKKRLPNPYPANGNIPLSNVNLSKELKNRWQKPGDELKTDIPGVYTSRVPKTITLQDGSAFDPYYMWGVSDLRVVSASFLRCQQLSLTWNIDGAWCARWGIKSLSLNATMNNVFVIADKKFDGFDPELGDSVQPKIYSFGVNIGF